LQPAMQNTSHTRPRQRDRLLALLKRHAPDWIPLAEVLVVAGAQYGARIYELRHLGHRIESKPGGGWFRLVTRPATDLNPAPLLTAPCSVSDENRLFPDDAQLSNPEMEYPD
jgi:hypothetical protein